MNYFDHAASSPIYPEVLELLNKTQFEDFANPSAIHIFGHSLGEKIEEFRGDFLKALKVKKNDVFIFTSSATESNNTVIRGLTFKEGDSIIYSKADHPSITAVIEEMGRLYNTQLHEMKLSGDGSIDQDHLSSLLNDEVKLVALTHVNNQSGVIQDIANIATMIKKKSKAHVHVDAVQSFGKITLNDFSSVDSVSLTSHKIGGPKGIAGLLLRQGHKIKPLILGGGQEHGFRSGTLAYPLIAGFHKAMMISMKEKEASLLKARSQYQTICAELTLKISGIKIHFQSTSPYIISFTLPKISSDIILRHLETRDVFISSTSACSSKISGFNPSLFALGIPEHLHKNFLRISLGSRTSAKEVEVLLKEFINVWDSLKHIR